MNIEEIIKKITNKRKIILIVAIIAITAIIIYIINMNNLEEEILINQYDENIIINSVSNNTNANNNLIENSIGQEKENIQNEEQKKSTIIIHVAGEVVKSGIVEIEEGQRIIDAIEKAGGATAQADLSKINLAYVLSDGQKIYIPKINEKYTGEYVTNASGTEETDNSKTGATDTSTIININTASAEELQTLQGIGESIAKRIVEYRKENGKFNTIEDIKNVSGIGESKYNKIKNHICVK